MKTLSSGLRCLKRPRLEPLRLPRSPASGFPAGGEPVRYVSCRYVSCRCVFDWLVDASVVTSASAAAFAAREYFGGGWSGASDS